MSPNERDQHGSDELASLNADNLDAGELGDQALEDVSGGALASCGTFSCGTYKEADKPVE
ncbi:MAG: hypothetical protein AB1941_22630 [Gemmatimonadota bacterium]